MSRPVTIEELRRVLEAMAENFTRRGSTMHDDVMDAIAALPAEQERSDSAQEPVMQQVCRYCSRSYDSSRDATRECWHGTTSIYCAPAAGVAPVPRAEQEPPAKPLASLTEGFARAIEAVREPQAASSAKGGWYCARCRCAVAPEEAEQRAAAARREALLEVAAECERRIQKWNDSLLHGVADWCRQRAEDVQ